MEMFRKTYRMLMAACKVFALFCIFYFVINIASGSKKTESKMSAVHIPLTLSAPTKKINNTTEEPPNNHTEDILIYDHPFSFLHLPMEICTPDGAQSNPFLLIVVKSDVNHIGNRMAIRSTWGIPSNKGIKVVFLLGYSPLLKTFVQMESNLYKDIIQETFLDDYRNNTIKTVMGFNWVSTHCPKAKYVFFVDDDYIVNIKYLWDHLNRLYVAGQRSIFTGCVWTNARIERNKASKWYISNEEFPGAVWPPYVSGGSSVVSTDIVTKMAIEFKFVKPIFIDDVYLGIVAKKLNITFTHDGRFHPLYIPERMAYLFTSHGFKSPKNLIEDWEKYHIRFDMVV